MAKGQTRAETEVSIQPDADRRPSWAPPLILGEELETICRKLGYLADDDKPIARLWANFATPKRSGRWLREHLSNTPLTGLSCRGFQLFAGSARGSTHAVLFTAQREESRAWRFGPDESFFAYHSSSESEWERLIADRERARANMGKYSAEPASETPRKEFEAQIERLSRLIEEIDALDLIKAQAHRDRQLSHARLPPCWYGLSRRFETMGTSIMPAERLEVVPSAIPQKFVEAQDRPIDRTYVQVSLSRIE